MNASMIVFLFFAICLAAVKAGVTRYGFGNAGFQPGGGIATGHGHGGYGATYNTYGTNVYYGGGVGGGYGGHGYGR